MTFLADIFEKLANDPSWPHKPHQEEVHLWHHLIKANLNDMARLALMVVEEKAEHINTLGGAPSMPLDDCRAVVFKTYDISRDHYARVKKRVGEVDTERDDD